MLFRHKKNAEEQLIPQAEQAVKSAEQNAESAAAEPSSNETIKAEEQESTVQPETAAVEPTVQTESTPSEEPAAETAAQEESEPQADASPEQPAAERTEPQSEKSEESSDSAKKTDDKSAKRQKRRVSFTNAMATLEPASREHWTGVTEQAYDHAVVHEDDKKERRYQPKIRRMSDSTRAKELRNRRKKLTDKPYSYKKDTPDLHTGNPAPPKRRKSKSEWSEVERIPEELKQQPYDVMTESIPRIEKAAQTQIDLSAPKNERVNIDVRYHEERRKRFDLPKEEKNFRNPEDKAMIRRDITELKMNLSVRVVLVGIVTLCSVLLTVWNLWTLIPLPRFLNCRLSPVSYVTAQILLGLLGLAVSGDLLKSGLSKLVRFKADCDSFAALSIVTAEIGAAGTLLCPQMLQNNLASIYIPAAMFSVWMNAVSKKMIVTRAQRNFEVLATDEQKYAIHYVDDERRAENLTKGTLGDLPILAAMQPTDKVTDFLRYTFSSDLGDHFCKAAAPFILGFSFIFALFFAILRRGIVDHALCYGLSIFALCISAGTCAGITLVSNLPLAIGTKRYVRGNGMLLGYQSVDDFYDINTIMVDVSTLFPPGTTKLESIQILGENRIEEALRFAASLTQHAGSILKDLFANAILTNEQTLAVEDYAYNEGSGISGWIENKRVLLGKREMMVEHNIQGLPPVAREEELTVGGNEAMYLSVSGTVSAMFIVSLSASRGIKKWLKELEQEGIHLLVRSNDALLSQRRIARMFAFPEEYLKIIPTRLENEYLEETKPLEKAGASMLCAGRLAGFVQTIVGAKRIQSAALLGAIIQAVSACLGMLCICIFLVLRAYDYLTGGVILIYQILMTLLTIAMLNLKEY